MPFTTAAGLVAAGVGVYNIIHGISQNKKANKLAADNPRPTYQIPEAQQQNLALAKSLAGQGLDDSTKQALLQNSQRGLTTTLDAQLRGGADPNAGGYAYQQYTNGISQAAIADNAAHVNNINNLIAIRGQYADAQNNQWQLNKYGPYANAQQAAAQYRSMAQSSINSGIGTLGKAAGSVLSSFSTPDPSLKGTTPQLSTLPSGSTAAAPWMASSYMPNYITPDKSNMYGMDVSQMNQPDALMFNNLINNNGSSPNIPDPNAANYPYNSNLPPVTF
jgi:hypothetical protein